MSMLFNLARMARERRNRKELYCTSGYWDSKARDHDGNAVSMWQNETLNRLYDQEQKDLINRLFGDLSGVALLDLGCGTGRHSRSFAAQGAIVSGLDFSKSALAIAERLSTGPNPVYRDGSLFDLTDETAYDAVFTWGVLAFACITKEELREALTRIRRALRAHGRLLLMEPIHSGFLRRVLKLTLAEYLNVMREAGLCVQSVAPLHFWPTRLILCYVSWPAWITVPLYHLGQTLMRVPGLARMADYWAILATPARSEV